VVESDLKSFLHAGGCFLVRRVAELDAVRTTSAAEHGISRRDQDTAVVEKKRRGGEQSVP